MIEYRVEWTAMPLAFNTVNVVFVKAATPEDAKAIARDHIERKMGITQFRVGHISEAKPVPAGEVVR